MCALYKDGFFKTIDNYENKREMKGKMVETKSKFEIPNSPMTKKYIGKVQK